MLSTRSEMRKKKKLYLKKVWEVFVFFSFVQQHCFHLKLVGAVRDVWSQGGNPISQNFSNHLDAPILCAHFLQSLHKV